jgi:hypothetical protein
MAAKVRRRWREIRNCKMETDKKFPFDPAAEINCTVFNYIKNLSAHSDISERLLKAIKPCGDVQIFQPDVYRYLAVSTQGIIFGFAIGQHEIAFRLNERRKAIALETGGKSFPACGPGWVVFRSFLSDYPKIDLEFWALKAYVNVREMAGLA